MRRRLTLTIVGVVAGALLVTGVGTLLLARRGALRDTERDLRREATAIAQAAEDARRPAAIAVLRQALKLEDAALSRFQPLRNSWAALPAGVSDGDLAALGPTTSVSGHHGSLAYAAGEIDGARSRVAVVLTRKATTNRSGAGFYVIAAAIALAIAAAVGDRLGRRITKPISEAEVATRRIAQGDLDTRLHATTSDPELASLVSSVNSMAERLEESRHLQRQFLLSVSHDLRTPLTSIRGFAEAIADGATTDTVRAAEVIAAEGRRLERLVGDLLDLARLDSKQFAFDPRPVDVGEVAADTVAGFQPAAAEIPVALAVDVDEDDATLLADVDPDRLAQVVANLVENALAWATNQITVAVEGGGRHVVLAVTDDGPGIPDGDLDRVFDRLYQSPRTGNASPRRVGSGLGLAIVAELVTAMHGTVRAAAGPAGGTRMIVTFPSATSSSA
jgi:signal transduction histidine kinase